MDIANLVKNEELFRLDVLHPRTDKPVGITIMVRSAASEAAMAVLREQTNEIMSRQQRKKTITAERAEENVLDQAVAFIASWDWGDNTYDGAVPGSDAATVKRILSKEGWLFAQVVNAANDIANFTKG